MIRRTNYVRLSFRIGFWAVKSGGDARCKKLHSLYPTGYGMFSLRSYQMHLRSWHPFNVNGEKKWHDEGAFLWRGRGEGVLG